MLEPTQRPSKHCCGWPQFDDAHTNQFSNDLKLIEVCRYRTNTELHFANQIIYHTQVENRDNWFEHYLGVINSNV